MHRRCLQRDSLSYRQVRVRKYKPDLAPAEIVKTIAQQTMINDSATTTSGGMQIRRETFRRHLKRTKNRYRDAAIGCCDTRGNRLIIKLKSSSFGGNGAPKYLVEGIVFRKVGRESSRNTGRLRRQISGMVMSGGALRPRASER